MTIKILIRKNLGMSPNKTAAQAVHAALGLYGIEHGSVIVLDASDKKFNEAIEDNFLHHLVTDAGLTEVAPGTVTAIAFPLASSTETQSV